MPFMESPYPVPDCSGLTEEQCLRTSLVQLALANMIDFPYEAANK